MVLGTVVSFVASLLVGAAVIYAAAAVIADVRDYSHAVVTALVGAIAWGIGIVVRMDSAGRPGVGPHRALTRVSLGH